MPIVIDLITHDCPVLSVGKKFREKDIVIVLSTLTDEREAPPLILFLATMEASSSLEYWTNGIG